jgi:hypothetical protein
MKVEVIEFYRVNDYKKGFIGTLHVYLPDLDIDLRGCPVFKAKGGYIIHLPARGYVEEGTRKKKQYPIIGFTKRETYDELIKNLKTVGNEFLKALEA